MIRLLNFPGTAIALAVVLWLPALNAAPRPGIDEAGQQFFESKIRPLLVKRCYACHSAKSDPIEGGLRLDSRAGWQQGGDSGPVLVPGKPNESQLMRAVEYVDEDLAMPPDGALPKSEIALIRRWIELGAPDPRTETAPRPESRAIDWNAARTYWAFQQLDRPRVPAVKDTSWPRNPIDHFVLSRLEKRGLDRSAPASRIALIRRATLGLTGLPPTPAEIAIFLRDDTPDAWSRLIERLLASPAYGERWARHWLDVVRYADDQLKNEYYYRDLPHAWRYRDWVIAAFNEDLPYNRFVLEQLAGDLLEQNHDHDGVVAVGLLAIGMNYQDDGGTPDGVAIARAETLDDRVDTVTRGFLALTVSCARCHDHKFDPIPTEDYYSLAGVFNNTSYVEEAPLASSGVVEAYGKSQARVAELTKQLAAARKGKDQASIDRLEPVLEEARSAVPPMYARAHSVRDSGSADMRIALRGNLRKPGPVAPRRFLRILSGDRQSRFSNGSGRLELARAIANPDNPLTARVLVNRLWQHHFGRGLVTTASNFGSLGERPTHPRLLDWLASRLIDSGWSIKQLHRDIMHSATFRLSAESVPANVVRDPGNRLLWRMDRLRLDIESWRDAMLAVSGTLDQQIGGPPVPDLLGSNRRTVYGAVHRDNKTDSDRLLRLFDFPNPRSGSGGRASTMTPQQQLFSLNNRFIIERARRLAARTADAAGTIEQRVRQAVTLTLGRGPSPAELSLAIAFLGDAADRRIAGRSTPWEQYCQVLLGCNEFQFRP